MSDQKITRFTALATCGAVGLYISGGDGLCVKILEDDEEIIGYKLHKTITKDLKSEIKRLKAENEKMNTSLKDIKDFCESVAMCITTIDTYDMANEIIKKVDSDE